MKNVLGFLLLLTACTTARNTQQARPATATVVDGKLFTSVFQYRAAEYKALCFQAYNLASLRLADAVRTETARPYAIITDIDETVLDNSRYQIDQVLQGKDYEAASWAAWTAQGIADTVPGAPAFLRYAASLGVQVFYITNRDEKERTGTLANLQRYGLPNADNEHLILRQGASSKEDRRRKLMERYNIALFIGDNLGDFNFAWDKKAPAERDAAVRQQADRFGSRYIIIPNPVYGDWEGALYQYRNDWTPAQKDSILRAALR